MKQCCKLGFHMQSKCCGLKVHDVNIMCGMMLWTLPGQAHITSLKRQNHGDGILQRLPPSGRRPCILL